MRRTTLCLIGLLCWRSGFSMDVEQPPWQMSHRVWTAADGAPDSIVAITQTTDGILWLGTESGLYRFDGIRFLRFRGATERPFESDSISDVEASPGGGLWVGLRYGGIAFVKDGEVVNYGMGDGLPDASVWKIVTDQSGTVWAAVSRGLLSLRGSRWEESRSESGESVQPVGLTVDGAGTLWVQTGNGILARPAGESRFRTVAMYAHPSNFHNTIAIAPDGAIWVGTPLDGVLRIDAPTTSKPMVTRFFADPGVGSLLFDRDRNLWLAADGQVRRLTPDTWSASKVIDERPSQLPRAGPEDALTLGRISSNFLEDREGNVWIATLTALHRFSHANVRVLELPESHVPEGLTAGYGGVVWAIAPVLTGKTSLFEIRDGAIVSRRVLDGRFSSEFWAPDGSLWLGGMAGLAHLVGGQFITTPLPRQAHGYDVQTLVRDPTGALWVSIVQKGVFRWVDGRWIAYGGLVKLPRVAAITEVSDPAGALWFGYTHSRIARVHGSTLRLFDASDGLDVGNVTALCISGTQLWAGGDFGLERLDGAHFVSVRAASGDPFVGLTGIVVTATGELWANGSAGIVRVLPAELAHAMRDPAYRVQSEVFDELDGVPGRTRSIRPTPSVIEASDGRLWFALAHGLASIDPKRLRRNPIPPPVEIWTVRAGDHTYTAPSELRLPAKTSDLAVDYAAGSLTIPERVQFRYMLEGFDRSWQDVGGRRQAFYTNLGPGRYTFHVVAANEDGVWNNLGASLHITIQPTFYQTRWFYALCTLTGMAVLWTLYGIRMRQVRSQVRGRLEERLIERERIARDLHDTLLQGIQGLILRFQVATDRIPRGEPARDLMERALERADEVLEESRSRVKELRVPLGGAGELSEGLAETAQSLSAAHSVPYSITVAGTPRALHPIVREETYLIASEAIANAYRHAKASKIEIELSYDDAAFAVSIRDDGRGIDGGVLTAGGKPEHWGLLGMRERARRIRGQLSIRSDSRAGTEVRLRLPAEMAYAKQGDVPRARGWRRFFPGGGTASLLV